MWITIIDELKEILWTIEIRWTIDRGGKEMRGDIYRLGKVETAEGWTVEEDNIEALIESSTESIVSTINYISNLQRWNSRNSCSLASRGWRWKTPSKVSWPLAIERRLGFLTPFSRRRLRHHATVKNSLSLIFLLVNLSLPLNGEA